MEMGSSNVTARVPDCFDLGVRSGVEMLPNAIDTASHDGATSVDDKGSKRDTAAVHVLRR